MRAFSRWVLPVVGAAVMAAPSLSAAQTCVGADIGVSCALTSTSSTADITGQNLGFTGPLDLQARYVGGLAGLPNSIFYFGAFQAAALTTPSLVSSAAMGVASPILIGGKDDGDARYTADGEFIAFGSEVGWSSLGSASPTDILLFGIRVDYTAWNYSQPIQWFYSGFQANPATFGDGATIQTVSRIFTSGSLPSAPAGNAIGGLDANLRDVSPFRTAYPDGTFIGFEDDPFAAGSDRDFNDGVIQLRNIYTAVPEPGSIALLAAGLLGLGVAARRRRQ